MIIASDTLLIALLLGGYAFTAGCYVFSWKCYKDLITNHIEHMKDRITELQAVIKKEPPNE